MARTSNEQPRYIRITDFGEDGITSKHEFVTVESCKSGCDLRIDDLLFARSGATVGKTYLHEDDSEPAVFAGYCIRFRFDPAKALPNFIYWWTKTAAYWRWVTAIQRPAGQPNINKEEFKSCLVPLPVEIEEQSRLCEAMDAARKGRREKLKQADALLAGLDDFLLDALGLTPPAEDSRRVFAVRLDEVERKQIGPSLYMPALRKYLRTLNASRFETRKLSDEVALNPTVDLEGCDENTTVSFIPMEAVAEGATGEVTPQYRALSEVRKGYTPFAEKDVLWAKITPCMENGKSCIASGLKNGIGFGSTEFHVLRPHSGRVIPEYVFAFMSQMALRRVARFAFTGSAGHQRVPADFLAGLPFPVPPIAVQESIAAEFRRRHVEARRLRAEAEAGWAEAKRWFEEQLLGPAP